MKEVRFNKDFDACPVCGSNKSLAKTAQQEVIERGIAKPDFHFFVGSQTGAALTPRMEATLPIGSKVPVIAVHYDVCMDCGCLYARHIAISDGIKSINKQPPPLVLGAN